MTVADAILRLRFRLTAHHEAGHAVAAFADSYQADAWFTEKDGDLAMYETMRSDDFATTEHSAEHHSISPDEQTMSDTPTATTTDTALATIEPQLAWSTEQQTEIEDRRSWLLTISLALTTAVAAAGAIAALTTEYHGPIHQSRPAPGSPSPTAQSPTPTDALPQADPMPTEILETIPVAATQDKDSRFIAILAAGKLRIYPQSHALDNAHAVCSSLAAGESIASVVDAVYRAGDNATLEDAQFFVASSVATYCPQ